MTAELSGNAARDFVEFVVRSIVDQPEQVDVTQTVDTLGVLVTLKVAREDMGKIIGREGQTAKSLRILLRMMGAKYESRFNLKIVEPEGSFEGM